MANQDFRVRNGLQVGRDISSAVTVGIGTTIAATSHVDVQGTITASGQVTASQFSGSGAGLTSIPSSQLSSPIPTDKLSGTYNISITGNMSGDTIDLGVGNTGVFAKNDGSLYVSGIATFKDNVILDSTNSIQIPVGTTEERGFRLLQTKEGSIGIGSNRITGINTSGIEQDQYILGLSGVLRSNTQVTSVGIGSIGIGLTALAGVTDGEFKFGTIDVVTGQIRYNSELSSFEGYGPGNAWGSLGGIKDVDQDTYITAESAPNADEDTITFYAGGAQVLSINGSSETAVISGPQNIILDPSPDDVVAIVEGDISAAGVSTITGITTTNIAVGNLIQEVDGVVSTGTTVTSVGVSQVGISKTSLGSTTNQEFTFVNQTPTGIVRVKGDFYIDGTRTEINSTTLTIDDLNVVVASGASNGLTADGAGLTVDGVDAYLKYNYNAGTDETWELNKNVGIGTDNATAKLDVNGTLNVSGVSTFHDDIWIPDNKQLYHTATASGGFPVRAILNDTQTKTFYREYLKTTAGVGKSTYISQTLDGVDYEVSLGSADNFYIGDNGITPFNDYPTYISFEVDIDGATSLYYNHNKKLETTGYGVSVTDGLNVSGIATAQLFSGDGGSLTNLSAYDSYKSNISERAFKTDEISGSLVYAPDGQRISGTSADDALYGLKTTLSKDGKIAFVSQYIDDTQSHAGGTIHILKRTGVNFTSIGIVTQTSHSSPGAGQTVEGFGPIVACNADATIFAVGSPQGIDAHGDNMSWWHSPAGSSDPLAQQSVQIFQRNGSTITNIGILTSPSPGTFSNGNDSFGASLAFSDDGSKLYVGSPFRNMGTGKDGAVFAYDKSGLTYNYVGIITVTSSSLSGIYGGMGNSVECSSDGNTIFVGHPGARRLHLGSTDTVNDTKQAGTVEIYDRSGSTFTLVGDHIHGGYFTTGTKVDQPIGKGFGHVIACSDDGNYFYATSYDDSGQSEEYPYGKLHLFKRESNTYSEVDSSKLESPYSTNNRLGFSVACDSSGSKVIAGEGNLFGGSSRGVVHYYARVGDNITRVGFTTSVVATQNGTGASLWGWDLDLDGSGEVGIIGAPYVKYVGDAASVTGNVAFLEQSRGTSVYSDIATGNIGIKTDTPLVALDVAGAIRQELHTPAMPVGLNDDIGLNWTSHDELASTLEQINKFVYCGDGIVIVTGVKSVSTDASIFRSTDYGKTWIEIDFNSTANDYNDIFSIVYCGNGIVIAGTGYNTNFGDIHRSTDYGLTWSKIELDNNFESIESLEYCGNGIVLAGGSYGAGDGDIWRSTDYGASWQREYDAANDGTGLSAVSTIVYCGNGIVVAGGQVSNTGGAGLILRSTDYGDTWNIIFTTNINYMISSEYCENGIVLITGIHASAAPIYRSTDYGLTWTEVFSISASDTFRSLEYCGNGIVLAGSARDGASSSNHDTGDMYRSVDYGKTWNLVEDFGATVNVIADILYCGNGIVLAGTGYGPASGYIYRSEVGFSEATSLQGVYHENLTGNIGIGTDNPTVRLDVYDDTSGSVATGGTTLLNLRNYVGNDLNQQKTFIDFIFTDDNNNETPQVRIGAEVGENRDANSETLEGSGAFVVYTNDADTTSGAAGASLAERFRVDYAGNIGIGTDNPLVALDVAGAIRQELHTPAMSVGLNDDIGVNWTKIDLGSSQDAIVNLAYCGNGIVLAAAQGNSAGDGNIYRSTDYGKTWVEVEIESNPQSPVIDFTGTLIYCGNGIVLAAITDTFNDSDIIRSTDYGLTWTKIEMGSNIDYIRSGTYCGNGIVVIGIGLGNHEGDFYRSTDYGQTWTHVSHASSSVDVTNIWSLKYCGDGIVLAGTGTGAGKGDIYRSYDYGQTWSAVLETTDLSAFPALEYCGNGIVLAGSGNNTINGSDDGDIYRSTNYGTNWTKVEMGGSLEYIYSLLYCGNGIVFAGAASGTGDGDIYKSTDFGLTWNKVYNSTTLTHIRDFAYCGNGIILASGYDDNTDGTGDIYRSDVGFSQASTIQGIYHQHLTGNIGIGSTQPTAKLDVNGDINVGAAVSLRSAYNSGLYPSDRLYITSTDPSRPGSIAIGTHGDWAGQSMDDTDIVMSAHDSQYRLANIAINQLNSSNPLFLISSYQDASYAGLSTEYSHIIQNKGELIFMTAEDDSSIYFGGGSDGTQILSGTINPLLTLNVNPSGSVDPNIVLGKPNGSGNKGLTITPVGGGVTIGGNIDISGITTIGNYLNIGGSDISIGSTTINGDQAITFDGTAGNLFTLTDNLTTGNLFAVNDISGFSVFEVDVDGTVRMGLATNDKVGIGSTTPTAKLDVDGTLNVSGHTELGSLNVSGVSTFSGKVSGNVDIDGRTDLHQTAQGSQAVRIYGNTSFTSDSSLSTVNPTPTIVVGSDYRLSGTYVPLVSYPVGTGSTTKEGLNISSGTSDRIAGINTDDLSVGMQVLPTGTGGEFIQQYTFIESIGISTVYLSKNHTGTNELGVDFNFKVVEPGSDLGNQYEKFDTLYVNAVDANTVDANTVTLGTHSIVSITTSHTASAGIPFTIDTFATSANDLAEYTIYVENGSNIQAQKVLVMQDGTTAYSQEYAVMYNPSKIVTIEASISGSNVLLQATPETGISGITNYKIVRGGLS